MAVQRAAAEALGDRKGAVVALDPRTGAVLAMVSYPRYDPNELDAAVEGHSTPTPTRPLLNRAIQGLYPPGSVVQDRSWRRPPCRRARSPPSTEFDDTGTRDWPGGYVVNNYDDKVYGEHDFTEAFASSINTTFAKVGVELGADTPGRATPGASASARRSPGRSAGPTSFFPDPGGMDKAHVAQASFGQGEVLATPCRWRWPPRRSPTAARS